MTDDDMCISIENHSVKFNKCGTGHSEWEYDTEVQEFSTSLSLFFSLFECEHTLFELLTDSKHICVSVYGGGHTHMQIQTFKSGSMTKLMQLLSTCPCND